MESLTPAFDQPIQDELKVMDLHHATRRALEWIVPGALITGVDLRFNGYDLLPDVIGWLMLIVTCSRLAKLMMPVTFPWLLAAGMCLASIVVAYVPSARGLNEDYNRINNILIGSYQSLAEMFFWGFLLSWMSRAAGRLGDKQLKRSVNIYLLLNAGIILAAYAVFSFGTGALFPDAIPVIIILSLILTIWIDVIRTRFGAAVLSETNYEKLISALDETDYSSTEMKSS